MPLSSNGTECCRKRCSKLGWEQRFLRRADNLEKLPPLTWQLITSEIRFSNVQNCDTNL
jgi:hypothetical protein